MTEMCVYKSYQISLGTVETPWGCSGKPDFEFVHTHWITYFVLGFLTSHRKYVTCKALWKRALIYTKQAVWFLLVQVIFVADKCWTFAKEIPPAYLGNGGLLFEWNKHRFDGQMPWALGGLVGSFRMSHYSKCVYTQWGSQGLEWPTTYLSAFPWQPRLHFFL